ncbi:type 2 periplasmic-binding domain-containing protein [Dongshaea marina]|uniref:hypothetical protein n=1 Tax=Dongshaea marina TaxID=2047966 RepID=UPI000D3E40D1|nr:hypothetical protein [Dongshaea marina]
MELLVSYTPLGTRYYFEKLDIPQGRVIQTDIRLLQFPLYIACSKQIPDRVINRWQQALDAVKSSGEYQKIYQKYLNPKRTPASL